MDINFGRIFCGHFTPSSGWFRVFGYGLAWHNRNIHPPLFSERYGYRKVLRLGRWSIEQLKPWPKPKEEVEEVPPIDGPEYTEHTEDQIREITRVYLDNYYNVINPKHSYVLEANDPTNPEV